MNWGQRTILIFAGLLLLLFGFNNVMDSFTPHSTLATVQFVLAVICFVIASRSRNVF